MSIPGSHIYRRLLQAEQDFRRQSEEAAGVVSQSQQSIVSLAEQRSEKVIELVELLLPELSADVVRQQYVDFRLELEDILAKRNEQRDRLKAEIESIQQRIENFHESFTKASEELAAAQNEESRKQKETTQALRRNDVFVRLSNDAAKTEQTLDRNEQRADELHRLADEKLPAYRDSLLFQYLKQRRYGEPSYRASFLTRRFDNWIARMIDFDHVAAGFDFLRTVPVRMRQEVRERRQAFEKALQQIETMEDETAARIGLRQASKKVAAAAKRREEIAESIAAWQKKRSEVESQLQTIESLRGPHYQQATELYVEWLSTLRAEALEELAAQTPGDQDDRLVAEIQWCDERLAETREAGARGDENRKHAAERMAGMQWVVKQFRLKRFDSANSVFDSTFDIETLLQRYAAGRSVKESLWAGIEGGQRERAAWATRAMHNAGISGAGSAADSLLTVVAEIVGESAARGIGRRMENRVPPRRRRTQM